jgi:predicted DCC family thiol-disulfide oxidoreductase YuxK
MSRPASDVDQQQEQQPLDEEAVPSEAILLFDGVCNLCNASVNFIIDRDPRGRIRFASLQSETGQKLLERFELPTSDFDTMVLVEGDRCYRRSTAGLRVARRLRQPWPLLYGLIIVPRPLRDAVYRLVAHNRYRWFGQNEACRVPTPELRERFLQ